MIPRATLARTRHGRGFPPVDRNLHRPDTACLYPGWLKRILSGMFVLFILGVLADTKRCNYLSVLQDAWQFITERFTKSLNIMGFAASLLTKNRTQLVSSNMQKKTQKKRKTKRIHKEQNHAKNGNAFCNFSAYYIWTKNEGGYWCLCQLYIDAEKRNTERFY